jgi:hypothetical protein
VEDHKTFVQQVEAIAKMEYHSEEILLRIDKMISDVESIEGIDQLDIDYMVSLLSKLKPLILQQILLLGFKK